MHKSGIIPTYSPQRALKFGNALRASQGSTPLKVGDTFTIDGRSYTVGPNGATPTKATPGPAGNANKSSGGTTKKENIKTGPGEKQDWHGTHMWRSEAGHEVLFGKTPKNREMWIKHPAGSYYHIDDDGNLDVRSKGHSVEVNMKDKVISVDEDFVLSVKGNLYIRGEKDVHIVGKKVMIESTGDNIDIKSAKNITQEGQNWTTSTNQNVDHKNGARFARTVGGETVLTNNGNKTDTTKGDTTTTVKGDSITMIGGEGSASAGGDYGIGGASVGIGATTNVKLTATTGGLTLKSGTGADVTSGGDIRLTSTSEHVITKGEKGTKIQDKDSPVGPGAKFV